MLQTNAQFKYVDAHARTAMLRVNCLEENEYSLCASRDRCVRFKGKIRVRVLQQHSRATEKYVQCMT